MAKKKKNSWKKKTAIGVATGVTGAALADQLLSNEELWADIKNRYGSTIGNILESSVEATSSAAGQAQARAGAVISAEGFYAFIEQAGRLWNNIFGGEAGLGLINWARKAMDVTSEKGVPPVRYDAAQGKLVETKPGEKTAKPIKTASLDSGPAATRTASLDQGITGPSPLKGEFNTPSGPSVPSIPEAGTKLAQLGSDFEHATTNTPNEPSVPLVGGIKLAQTMTFAHNG